MINVNFFNIIKNAKLQFKNNTLNFNLTNITENHVYFSSFI